MKVVINVCFGGFGLTDAAILECVARGMTITTLDADRKTYVDPAADFSDHGTKQWGNRYHPRRRSEKTFRCNPALVSVVEEMGEAANGDHAKLKVVEIPFDGPDGWEIDEYDGTEKVVPVHASWC